jgi:hypothetical protein
MALAATNHKRKTIPTGATIHRGLRRASATIPKVKITAEVPER